MGADPKPDDCIPLHDAEGAIVIGDPCGPVRPHFNEEMALCGLRDTRQGILDRDDPASQTSRKRRVELNAIIEHRQALRFVAASASNRRATVCTLGRLG